MNGFNQAIQAVYPKAEIQRCIVHQIRSSLKFVSWKDKKAVAKDLKTIYTAKTEEDAQLALTEFNEKANKRVYITTKVGGSFIDKEILKQLKRDIIPRPDCF